MGQAAIAPPLHIATNGGPIKSRFYRLPPDDRKSLKAEIDSMLQAGIITVSESPWSSPCFIAHCPNHRDRKVADYRRINAITTPDVYPLNDIDEIFDTMVTAKYFGAADLKCGFWQVEVDACCQEKTAFISQFGLHEYKRCPFGLRNCPSHFMRAINGILDSYRLRGSEQEGGGNAAFVDDLTTYGKSFETYLKWQEKMFEALRERRWKLSLSKLRLGYQQIKLLGHVVGMGKLTVDPAKVEAVLNLQEP